MDPITVATFNCENLFTRFHFSKKLTKSQIDNAVTNGFMIDKTLFYRITPEERKLTALAIKDTKADIIALQEIENLDTLKSFQSEFLKIYPYQYLIDANDPRLIDVAVLSKFEAKSLVTHQFDKLDKAKIFSRDCLEIEFKFDSTVLTLFVNHLKSMLGGRDKTMAKRKIQSERIVQILQNKYGDNINNENFIVLGDFNDSLPSDGVEPIVNQPWVENVIKTRLPENEQWTHWYDAKNSVSQLDYILISKRLAEINPNAVPAIVRKGLAKKAKQYTGPRYPGVGDLRPSASDHCPVGITINL